MRTAYERERLFDEQTVETFAGELTELRLGLVAEQLGLELVGPKGQLRWLMSQDGQLMEWNANQLPQGLAARVEVQIGLFYPEVLEPVVLPEETELVCILEVSRGDCALYVEGHWRGGRFQSVRVTQTGHSQELQSAFGRLSLGG